MEVQNAEVNPDQEGLDPANYTGTERVADDELNCLHQKNCWD